MVYTRFSVRMASSLWRTIYKRLAVRRLEFKENGGESYIFASSEKKFKHAKSLLLREVEPVSVTSAQSEAACNYFKNGGSFHRFLLVNVVSHLTQQRAFLSFNQLLKAAESTFWFALLSATTQSTAESSLNILTERVRQSILKMRDLRLIVIIDSTCQSTISPTIVEKKPCFSSRALMNWAHLFRNLTSRPKTWQMKPTLLAKAIAKSGLPIIPAIKLCKWPVRDKCIQRCQ